VLIAVRIGDICRLSAGDEESAHGEDHTSAGVFETSGMFQELQTNLS